PLLASASIRPMRGESMSSEPDAGGSLDRRYATVAEDALVARTAAALEGNGMRVLRAVNAEEAKRVVLDLIPAGAQVYHGASQSLEDSGIAQELEQSGRFEPLRPRVFSMDARHKRTRFAA